MKFQIKPMSCENREVIYLFECPCDLQCVGRTLHKLKTRLKGHIYNIKIGLETRNIAVYFKRVHICSPKGLKFQGIDNKSNSWGGGEQVKNINQFKTGPFSPKLSPCTFSSNGFESYKVLLRSII